MQYTWTCILLIVQSFEVRNEVSIGFTIYHDYKSKGWLCQANHIFERLQITANHADYGTPSAFLPESRLTGYQYSFAVSILS